MKQYGFKKNSFRCDTSPNSISSLDPSVCNSYSSKFCSKNNDICSIVRIYRYFQLVVNWLSLPGIIVELVLKVFGVEAEEGKQLVPHLRTLDFKP